MGFLRNRVNELVYTVNRNVLVAEQDQLLISVQNGQIVVDAPLYLSDKKIQRIMEQKRKIILENLKKYEVNKKVKSISKPITILGKEYNLDIMYKNVEKPELNLERNSVNVVLPLKYRNSNKEKILNTLIEKLYDKLAEKNMEYYMEKIRIKFGFCPEDYEIKRMKNLYGKCDGNKKIYINPDIMKFDTEIIEYVIMHEFCHLKYKIHSKGFKDLMEKNCSNYFDIENKIENIQF